MSQLIREYSGLNRQNFADDEAFLQGRITFSFALVYALAWLLYIPVYLFWLPNWPAAVICFLGGFCTAGYGAYVIRTRQDIGRGGIWANMGGCLSLLAVATVTGGMFSPILGWIFFGSITTFLCHGRGLGLLIVGTSWVGILAIDVLHLTGRLQTYAYPFAIDSQEYKFYIILAHCTIIPALGLVTSLFDRLMRNAYIQAQKSRKIADANLQKLRFVFESLSYGVLTIEADGRIGEEYSKVLESILDKSGLGGREAIPTVFEKAQMSPDAYQKLISAVQASMGELEIAFEVNEDCFPRELEFFHNSQRKLVEVDWRPMLGEQGTIDKILLSLKDITEQRSLADKAKKWSEDHQLLATLVQMNKEHFLAVYKSGCRYVAESLQILAGHPVLDKELLKILLMNIHTVKGECRSAHLQRVVEQAHELEELCVRAKHDAELRTPDRVQLQSGYPPYCKGMLMRVFL